MSLLVNTYEVTAQASLKQAQGENVKYCHRTSYGTRGDLVVSALDSGSKMSGFEPWPGHCVVFLGKTLYSHGASLHPGVNGYQQTVRETLRNAGRLPAVD